MKDERVQAVSSSTLQLGASGFDSLAHRWLPTLNFHRALCVLGPSELLAAASWHLVLLEFLVPSATPLCLVSTTAWSSVALLALLLAAATPPPFRLHGSGALSAGPAEGPRTVSSSSSPAVSWGLLLHLPLAAMRPGSCCSG